jgi:hypothetical protein
MKRGKRELRRIRKKKQRERAEKEMVERVQWVPHTCGAGETLKRQWIEIDRTETKCRARVKSTLVRPTCAWSRVVHGAPLDPHTGAHERGSW